jgi:hypothetical protein
VNVSIIRGGGIGGIATRTQLASEELPPAESRKLQELASAVAPASEDAGGGPRHPDETLYKVMINGLTATHTETTLPEPVRALIDFVSERPERQDGLVNPKRGLTP